MKILSSKKTSVILFIMLGCAMSVYGYGMVEKERNAKIQSSFDEQVSDEAAAIQQKMDDYFDAMQSLQSFYLSSNFVSRTEFHLFASRIAQRLDGVQAFKWLPLVKGDKRVEFESAISQEGFPGFQIKDMDFKGEMKPAELRKEYFPVTYAEPWGGNEKSIGFDMISVKSRADAILKAIKLQNFSIISTTRLVQDVDQKIFLVFLPVYKNANEGGGSLQGVLMGSFLINRIIEKELLTTTSGQNISGMIILDVSDKNKPGAIYALSALSFQDKLKSEIVSEKEFEVNGYVLKILARPSLKWLEINRSRFSSLSILFMGLGATVLFALYLSLFIDRTRAVEKAVALRTLELADANERISSSERNFRGLVLNIPGAIYRCAADKNWTMEFISDEIKNISGYSASDFIGNKVRSYSSIIHPEDAPKVERDVWLGINSNSPFILEYRILDSEGKERWVYEKGQAIFSAEKNVLYLDGAIFDITERKRLSEQLLQSKKMEAVGKLAGGIAHDFNNQLMVILGYCQILLERMQPSQTEYPHVQDIKFAAEKSSALVRQLLAFGRKNVVSNSVFDLNTLITSVEKMTRTVLGERIKLDLKLEDGLGRILMDQSQMEQVLLNMVVNARDAMPKGGVLNLETQNVKITDRLKPAPELSAGDYILLTVKDSGVGMNDEVKKHLFEPFFTTKDKDKGAGLGLATCYTVILGAGGIIQVQSRAGEGAVFSIYVPVSANELLNQKVESLNKEIPGGHETILLVEDEDKVRNITGLILKNRGYKVLDFASGREAIEFVEKSGDVKIDLLLSDVVMPEISGIELADKIKEICPNIQVLFMSGYMEDNLLREGIERQKVNFLNKPCEAGVMCQKLREILDSKIEPPYSRTAA